LGNVPFQSDHVIFGREPLNEGYVGYALVVVKEVVVIVKGSTDKVEVVVETVVDEVVPLYSQSYQWVPFGSVPFQSDQVILGREPLNEGYVGYALVVRGIVVVVKGSTDKVDVVVEIVDDVVVPL